jgi:hypothetical protein
VCAKRASNGRRGPRAERPGQHADACSGKVARPRSPVTARGCMRLAGFMLDAPSLSLLREQTRVPRSLLRGQGRAALRSRADRWPTIVVYTISLWPVAWDLRRASRSQPACHHPPRWLKCSKRAASRRRWKSINTRQLPGRCELRSTTDAALAPAPSSRPARGAQAPRQTVGAALGAPCPRSDPRPPATCCAPWFASRAAVSCLPAQRRE